MVRVLYPVPAKVPAVIRLEDERFHHLAHVLRVATGEEVEVFDGQGRSFLGRIEAIHRTSAEISLGPALPPRQAGRITLVQALPKADKLDWILQKGTELGAAAFAPVEAERCVIHLSPARAAERAKRWSRICEEAARQCSRARVPRVVPLAPLLDRARDIASSARLFVLDEEERSISLSQAFSSTIEDNQPVALVIGPEGGLSRREVSELQRLGGITASLGARTLRTETAAIAALAVALHLDGQLG